MSKFNEVKNEALNLRSDARKALLIDLLRAEENHVANSMIPLEADHRAAMKKEEDDRLFGIAMTSAAVAALTGAAVILAVKGKRKLEEEARKAKLQLEQEKKDMIRKLAQVKGRH